MHHGLELTYTSLDGFVSDNIIVVTSKAQIHDRVKEHLDESYK